MQELTRRERLLRLLRGEPIDRIPVSPRIAGYFTREWLDDPGADIVAGAYEIYRHFGWEIIDWNCTPHFEFFDFGGPDPTRAGSFVALEGPGWKPEVKHETSGDTTHEIVTVTTPGGQLRRVLSTTRLSKFEQESALTEYPIKTERDFELICQHMPPVPELDCSELVRAKALLGEDGVLSPSFHGPFNLLVYCYRKLDDLMLDCRLNPDFFHAMMEFFLQRIMKYLQQMIDTGTVDLFDIFFLADDIGDPEASCYGAKYVDTPNIDALAEGGVKFETCFATPLCQPSRVEFLTGRYAFRTGFYHNWGAPRESLVPKNLIFAQLLQKAGYKTFVAGKWHHVGVPSSYGFDQSCITWGMDDKKWITDGSKYQGDPEWQGYYASYWWPRVVINDHHYLATKPDDYGPDICAERTIDFMTRNRQRPFAAFFLTTLVHHPWLPTPDNDKPGVDRKKEDFVNFKPGVEYTDKLVGRLVAALDKLGLRQRTIVFYAGDNGPAQNIGPDGKAVNGGKSFAVEEGCRVPMIVNCPGIVRKIGSCGELIDFSDLLPTFVELAGGTLPPDCVLDGRSFAPLLSGKPFQGRQWIYGPLADKRILRDEHWLYEGDARFFSCGDLRDGDGYREITDSQEADAVGTRQRFEKILSQLPTPGKQGAPDIDWADYHKWEQWVLKRVPSYSIVAYKGMKRPPKWFVEKYPQWFPDFAKK